MVDGLVRAADIDLGFAILNLGAGRRVSILEFVGILEKELGAKADVEWLPAQAGDVARTWADIEAARQALGYAPQVSIEAGIARFVRWLEEAA